MNNAQNNTMENKQESCTEKIVYTSKAHVLLVLKLVLL